MATQIGIANLTVNKLIGGQVTIITTTPYYDSPGYDTINPYYY